MSPSPRRRMAALALVLAVGLAWLVAERVARSGAEAALAERVRVAEHLRERPEVSIAGGSFLLQVARGRYDRLTVAAEDVPGGPVLLRRVDVELTGVRLGLLAALTGRVGAVPVDRMQVSAVIGYGELERALDRRVEVAPAGDRLRLTGRVRVLGQELSAAADSEVLLEDGDVLLRAQEVYVGSAAADAALSRAVRGRFDRRLDPPALPFGLHLDRLVVTPDGLAASAGASDAVLPLAA